MSVGGSKSIENWASNPEEDHGPLMTGCAWTLWAISGLFLGLRLYVRAYHRRIWYDDAFLSLGWLSLSIECILNQMAIGLGFGKHALDIDVKNLDKITLLGASGLTITTIAINASKISFAITLVPLTTGWARYYVFFAIYTLVIFAIPVAVLPWVQCRPLVKTFIEFYPGECIDKRPSVLFGIFQSIWAALMDISLAVIPWKILWNLQMRTPEKIGVIVAMSLGMLAGATAVIRSMFIQRLSDKDLSYDAVDTIIWSVTESAATIVAASIPVLRKFLKDQMHSAVTCAQQGSLAWSKRSQPRMPKPSHGLHRQSIELLAKSSQGNLANYQSRTYSALDDPDDKRGTNIIHEHQEQHQK